MNGPMRNGFMHSRHGTMAPGKGAQPVFSKTSLSFLRTGSLFQSVAIGLILQAP